MSRIRLRTSVFALLAGLLAVVASGLWHAPNASAARQSAVPFKRDILGLYDGTSEPTAKGSRLHRMLEMPLNHLGYRLTLHDISHGLPALQTLTNYHAIATWFSGEISDGSNYLQWAAKAARNGTKFVVLDSVGLLGAKHELPAINAFLGELGLAYVDYFVSDSKSTRIDVANPTMIGFEAKLKPEALPGHQVVITRSPKVNVHLAVTDPAHRWANAKFSALVTTGPSGGLISSGFATDYDEERKVVRWIVDPFEFLEAALGGGMRPVPDTTTASGRRIYFSHIDGDGWNNVTTVQPFADKREPSAAAMLGRLIAPYPDLPVSVGLIAGDVDPLHGGVPQAADIARRIFALPQVETASHTCTHPYHWAFYESYGREAEIARVLRFAEEKPGYDDRSLASLVRHWRHQNLVRTTASDTAANDSRLPRARPHQPFDLDVEVKGALDRATRLAPAHKPARLYLWSGDTTPFEAAIHATRHAGVRNMNGGDSRLDATYPSVAYVAPVGISVGNERQIYAVNSNENTYTNGWTGPFDAFKQLSETLDNTEGPRRLKGFNLYYHSYAASRPDSLDAVIIHLDRARREPVTPIRASHYAAIAEGFYSSKILSLGPLRWRVSDRGALDTIRFDHVQAVTVDYAASVGVIGHRQHQGSLYLTLDSDARDPVVALTSEQQARGRTNRPYLIESRWIVSKVTPGACGLTMSANGYGAGEFTWGGFAPGDYEVMAVRNDRVLHKADVAADQSGRLAYQLPVDGIEPVSLRITCRGATHSAVSGVSPTTPKSAKPKGTGTVAASRRQGSARVPPTAGTGETR